MNKNNEELLNLQVVIYLTFYATDSLIHVYLSLLALQLFYILYVYNIYNILYFTT